MATLLLTLCNMRTKPSDIKASSINPRFCSWSNCSP